MSENEAKKRLESIKNASVFTEGLTLTEWLEEMCGRFARVYAEILPQDDYEYILNRLEDLGMAS